MVMRANPGLGVILRADPRERSLLVGLNAYWPLDESSGTRRDLSGNALTLTDNNTVTGNPGPSGKLPLASQFTLANSEYLSIADSPLLSIADEPLTVCAWLYLDSNGSNIEFVGKADSTILREWGLEYLFGTTAVRFWVSANGSTQVIASITQTLNTGTWYFLRGWHDPVENTVNIQINNGAVTSVAHTTGGNDGGSSVRIGAIHTIATAFMNGRELAIPVWKRVLSLAEGAYLYNGGLGRTFVPGQGWV